MVLQVRPPVKTPGASAIPRSQRAIAPYLVDHIKQHLMYATVAPFARRVNRFGCLVVFFRDGTVADTRDEEGGLAAAHRDPRGRARRGGGGLAADAGGLHARSRPLASAQRCLQGDGGGRA